MIVECDTAPDGGSFFLLPNLPRHARFKRFLPFDFDFEVGSDVVHTIRQLSCTLVLTSSSKKSHNFELEAL
jgi:hypothetical protein